MKTPRQILFEKHQAVTPKLDLIRQRAISPSPALTPALSHPMGEGELYPAGLEKSIPWKLWLELIWPARRVWLGVAGLWVIIAVLNFSIPEEAIVMASSSPMNQKTMAGLQEQNRLMTQLLRADESEVFDAEEPARSRTRSDIRSQQMIG